MENWKELEGGVCRRGGCLLHKREYFAFVIMFCYSERKPGSIRANMTVGGLKPQG